MQHPLHPSGPPVHEFFGGRYLRCRELIEIGIVDNRVSLNRLIKAGKFPAPLRLTARMLLWDSNEIAALIDRLSAERGAMTATEMFSSAGIAVARPEVA
jgi:predicted DNA-binding transcriptional regulator AlpA